MRQRKVYECVGWFKEGRRGVTDVHSRLPWIVYESMSSSATYETIADQCYEAASFIEEAANECPTEHILSYSNRVPVDGWTANTERGYFNP